MYNTSYLRPTTIIINVVLCSAFLLYPNDIVDNLYYIGAYLRIVRSQRGSVWEL